MVIMKIFTLDKMEVDHTVAYGICDMESCGNAVHCDPLQEKQKNLHFCSQCQEILSQRKYLIESMQDSSSLVSNYSSIHVAFDPSYSFASKFSCICFKKYNVCGYVCVYMCQTFWMRNFN